MARETPHYNKQSSQFPEHNKWENSLCFLEHPRMPLGLVSESEGEKLLSDRSPEKALGQGHTQAMIYTSASISPADPKSGIPG
ncbi:uncharacterized protein BO96DRAFT_430622 [Aspergillus niger CBS 101883]|uniref:uncharacterized protein n=1 Tax=Aspergillus lacticoffeatus (strain CBS 101883) TaxID=1450533 RepID=UPI000D7EF71E|nr:uncharacterized protein BO96DRAFT_430622 [Aspergillus niger CBS 101883]PYH60703.1 hypothetical protein BO96DRAFT_430622 [Aspergillus niger CBS 101883]